MKYDFPLPRVVSILLVTFVISIAASGIEAQQEATVLHVEHDESAGAISVFRTGTAQPIVTQHADADHRPFLHPIVAPDGRGSLTEYSPGHHKHQTGLYWGFTRVNGRDYFHHPQNGYWNRVSAGVLKREAASAADFVQWQTVYDLLDEDGVAILRETQTWTMRDEGGQYLLDLDWSGKALSEVTIGKYDYGGLFLRMPWREGIAGKVVNSARQSNQRAEGQRAVWVDVGMQVKGRDDLAHIAIFDHPSNAGYPQPWRVDKQLGVGPARARLGDWTIAEGNTENIRHRLVCYTGQLNDKKLMAEWAKFSGRVMPGVQWKTARKEGLAAKFLTPEEAVAEMTVPEGFQVNAFAAEPMITQPMAFCWDHRGRLWIAENRDYESRQTGFSASGDSRILILEDTDRDGVADKRTVFAEGIPFPAAMAIGFDGLWLGAPPNLLFIPDRNADDQADVDDIEVRLTGWGIRDRHETINSFHWGPDGWLYGLQGFATPSKVGKPAGKGKIYKHNEPFPKDIEFAGEPTDINGGVWRYHPTQDRFEVVAHGFSNPWGIDYDRKGNLFITACVIPHLWHVIPGGIYHRQGGSHFNPYVYNDIKTIADHRHRSAHGGARIYQSDAFPPKYQDRIFMANIHEHAVLTDILEPRASGFVGRHGDDFLLANNAQWIGFSMEIGPDGSVYVLDWHDADICGTEVLNKNTGRVFRISPEQSSLKSWPNRYADLEKLSDAHLVQLQLSESGWHARHARTILQHRSAKGVLESKTRETLQQMFAEQTDGDLRLRAMWALHVTGGIDEQQLIQALSDDDEHVRAWGIQLLCEDQGPSAMVLQRFAVMAKEDPSPVVRLYLAAALQRMPLADRWPILQQLVLHDQDAADHNLPKMIWFGLEPGVVKDSERALQIAAISRLPVLTRYVARRLTDANQLDAVVNAIAHFKSNESQLQLLYGLRDGLEGEVNVGAPKDWATVYEQLQASGGEASRLALQLSQQFGDTIATTALLKTLKSAKAPVEHRRQALRALAGQRLPELEPILLSLLENEELQRDAIRAAANLNTKRLGKAMLDKYPKLSDESKLDVVHSMATRSSYGRQLTDAIETGHVPRRDVPTYIARVLQRVVGNGFLEVWGPIETLAVDQKAAFEKYRRLLSDDAFSNADLRNGRAIFNRTCLSCHRLYGEGGAVGPDITGADRSNLEYLLGNIITPSAIIQDAYRMEMVLTDEGRVYSGISAGENERQLRLRVADQKEPIVIAKSMIESRELASISMMPSGMLETLTAEEVIDLITYLRTRKQVPLPD
ncbi:MAG: PVC-type heme-binding CxxCH protein [Aeoliella sp.]